MNFFSSIKQHYQTPPNELFSLRAMLTMIIVFTPPFGWILIILEPTVQEYFTHRFIISFLGLVVFILSFKNQHVRIFSRFYVYCVSYILLAWVIWISSINNFIPIYCYGLLLTLCAVGLTIKETKEMIGFLLFFLPLIAIFTIQEENLNKEHVIFLLTAFILGLAIIVIQYDKSYALRLQEKKRIEEKTELVKQHALLIQQRNLELEDKNKELAQFNYIASHDLKSPLRNIASFVQLIKRKLIKYHDDDELFQYIDFTVKGVKQMEALINDLLIYTNTSQEHTQYQKCEVTTIFEEALQALSPFIEVTGAQINVNIPAISIIANPSQMQLLFHNIIHNAIKFNKSNPPIIIISYKEALGKHIFKIEDNGIGIDTIYQEKVFLMFQKLHNAEQFEGTGLGLALCKKIVKRHQGNIKVSASPQKGSIFTVEIPQHLK